MSKVIFFLAILMSVATLQAQDFQGKAIYQSKTTIDLDLDSRQIPADRKKQIMEKS